MSRPEAIEAIVLATSTNETKAKGRVRKVTFEIPAEGSNPFEGLGGERIHIVVVRLNNDETPIETPAETDEAGRKRRFHEMNPAAQIAMACSSPSFREYLRLTRNYTSDDKDTCDHWVKGFLRVGSKTEVRPGTEAFGRWAELHGSYSVWLRYERSAA